MHLCVCVCVDLSAPGFTFIWCRQSKKRTQHTITLFQGLKSRSGWHVSSIYGGSFTHFCRAAFGSVGKGWIWETAVPTIVSWRSTFLRHGRTQSKKSENPMFLFCWKNRKTDTVATQYSRVSAACVSVRVRVRVYERPSVSMCALVVCPGTKYGYGFSSPSLMKHFASRVSHHTRCLRHPPKRFHV